MEEKRVLLLEWKLLIEKERILMKKRDVENNSYHSFLDVLLKKSSYTYTFEKSISKKQKSKKAKKQKSKKAKKQKSKKAKINFNKSI
jgi:hypothetical protein